MMTHDERLRTHLGILGPEEALDALQRHADNRVQALTDTLEHHKAQGDPY